MNLLIETAMVFFGTLMAAALLALGAPAGVELVGAKDTPPAGSAASQVPLASSPSLAAQENLVVQPGR